MNIGFIGAGLMGEGMARNLIAGGHQVRVLQHRNAEPIDRLVADGATKAVDLGDIARNSEVLFLCLPNADVVTSILEAAIPDINPGVLIVDTTTSLPSVTCSLFRRLSESSISFVDAPVTGAPSHAEAGELMSLVGATETDLGSAKDLLNLTSRKIVHFGPPGSGHAAKLINNFFTQAQSALTIEAIRRCDKLGIDRAKIFEVISESGSRSGTFMKIMPSVLAETYDGHQFSLANAAKDVDYVRTIFDEIGEPSLVADGLRDFYQRELRFWPPDIFLSRLLQPDSNKKTE